MGFCGSMFKSLLFLINLLFFLVGCSIIGLGTFVTLKTEEYEGFFHDGFNTSDLKSALVLPSSIFITVGVLITVISFLGCCAVCQDSKCMMYSFAIIIFVILIAQIAVAVVMFLYKDKAYKKVSDGLTEGLKGYGINDTAITTAWDNIQEDFKCCGVKNANDWTNTTFGKMNPDKAPDSCCEIVKKGCGDGKLPKGTGLNSKGCLEKFDEFVESHVNMIGGVGIGLFLFQLIMVIVACVLANHMGE